MIRMRVPVVLLVVALFVTWLPLAAEGPRWKPIGPDGAAVQALAAGPGVVYAGTRSGGAFKSTDGGGSWTAASGGRQEWFIQGLALHPSDGRRVVAATLDGVFRTVDGGDRWTRTGEFSAGTVAAAPSDPNVFYVAGHQQVFRSEDGGATWTATGEGAKSVTALAVDPANPWAVYAGTGRGFFRSFNGGSTWEASNSGITPSGRPQAIQALAVDPRNPATLWAVTNHLFKSTDRGATWSAVEAGLGRSELPTSLAVDPESGTVWMGCRGFRVDGGVYRGEAGGTAWSKVFRDPSVLALAVDPAAPGRLFVGSEVLGVSRSEDGGRGWEPASQGLRALEVTDLEVDPRGPGRVFAVVSLSRTGRGGPLVVRGDGQGNWATVLGNATADPASTWFNDVAVAPGRRGALFVGGNDGVRKSLDGGATWLKRNKGLRTREYVSHIAVAPSDPQMVYALGWGSYPVCDVEDCPRVILYRSENGGASWTVAARFEGERPNALMVAPEDPWEVYVGGSSRLWKSLNGGARWEPGAREPEGSTILSLAAVPGEPNTLYAGAFIRGGLGLWKSGDGGRSWSPAAAGIHRSALVLRIVPDPAKPGTLYAATDRGVYVSENRAGLWAPLLNGLTTYFVHTVALGPRGRGGVYAGTRGGDGVFALEGR
jgi:photosystem II stability/assembly factor-like uncharacterized protein